MNESLFDALAILAGSVAIIADQRRAVLVASIVVAIMLSPLAATFGGIEAALLLYMTVICAAAAGGLIGYAARRASLGRAAIDPTVPAYIPKSELFGSRSRRVAAAALGIPVASWISYNVPVGSASDFYAVIFPVAFLWICGGVRLLLARSVEDLAVGMAVVGLASGCGWIIQGGPGAIAGALPFLSLTALAIIAGDLLRARGQATRGDLA